MLGGLVSSQTAIGFGLLVAFCLQMAMNAGTPVLLTSISIFPDIQLEYHFVSYEDKNQ